MLFSIIVPTYNRPEPLTRCLASLRALDFDPEQFEVLIVDDGGQCDLSSLDSDRQEDVRVRLLRQPNRGPGAARNYAASEARGKHLVFIDDDCLASPTWLQDYARAVESDPEALWGGRVVTEASQNLYCHAAQAILDMNRQFFNRVEGEARFFSSNNFAVPAARFLELGGFLHAYFQFSAEDRDFCDRWRHSGRPLRSLNRAIVYHEPELTLTRYAKMYFRYGRGAYRFQRIRKLRGSGSMNQDARFHLHLPGLLSQAVQRVPVSRRVGLVGLVGLWEVANTAGFFWELMIDKLQRTQGCPQETTGVVQGQVSD